MTVESVSYSEAIEEVESILNELEGNVVDVDLLSQRVRRASELLKLCRERLATVEVDVAAVVADLDHDAEPAAASEATPADG